MGQTINKRWMTAIAITVLVGMLSACAPYSVYSDASDNVDFSAYKTFAWLEPRMKSAFSERASPLVLERTENSIESELINKGFRRVGKGDQPDFLVQYNLAMELNRGARTSPSIGFGVGSRHRSVFWGTDIETYEYTTGIVTIDLFDAASQRPIWRGSADKDLLSLGADKSSAEVREVIRKILAQFPPGTDSSIYAKD